MNPLFPRLFCDERVFPFPLEGPFFPVGPRRARPHLSRREEATGSRRRARRRRPRREHVMSGAKLRTEKAVNSVMADQTIETELAQLVSEYLQHHRCERAYEVRPFGTRAFPERRQSSVRARPALARPVSFEDAQSE